MFGHLITQHWLLGLAPPTPSIAWYAELAIAKIWGGWDDFCAILYVSAVWQQGMQVNNVSTDCISDQT